MQRMGPPPTFLDPLATEVEDELTAIAAAEPADAAQRLRRLVGLRPTLLAGWASLSEAALAGGLPIEAYAFARVGYHRGLDLIRSAGWRGAGPVPWSHAPNRGFLRAVAALMEAAAAIGEVVEAQRCRDFLLALDPDDAQGVSPRRFGVLPMA